MPGLLWFSRVPEGGALLLWCVAGAPFVLMQLCLTELEMGEALAVGAPGRQITGSQ
jgi:hypothetical protein